MFTVPDTGRAGLAPRKLSDLTALLSSPPSPLRETNLLALRSVLSVFASFALQPPPRPLSSLLSANFHQTIALSKQCRDLRHFRHQPFPQRRVRRVTHAQPDNARTASCRLHAQSKVLVLGDDGAAVFRRPSPDRAILRIPQTNLTRRLRLETRFSQPPRESGWQLSIDQKFHRLDTSTG